MTKFFKNNVRLLMVALCMFALNAEVNAQITYSSSGLSMEGAPKHSYFGITIAKWPGLYWTCKDSNFFQLDLSPNNPRIAGTGDQIVFYNSETSTFNSIQVANVYNYSDARAKENVKTLTTGLDAILNLRPVTYQWKKSDATPLVANISIASETDSTMEAFGPSEENTQYGFLAQEVENVIPEAVKTDEDGHKMINYTAIIPMLVQAIQELQSTVELQEQKIQQLSTHSLLKGNAVTNKYKILGCTPNPTNGNVTISTQLDTEAKTAVLVIRSLTGTEEMRVNVSNDSPSVNVNASTLSTGMHIVTLYVNDVVCDSARLVKE